MQILNSMNFMPYKSKQLTVNLSDLYTVEGQ